MAAEEYRAGDIPSAVVYGLGALGGAGSAVGAFGLLLCAGASVAAAPILFWIVGIGAVFMIGAAVYELFAD
jgi:hypothetical protein